MNSVRGGYVSPAWAYFWPVRILAQLLTEAGLAQKLRKSLARSAPTPESTSPPLTLFMPLPIGPRSSRSGRTCSGTSSRSRRHPSQISGMPSTTSLPGSLARPRPPYPGPQPRTISIPPGWHLGQSRPAPRLPVRADPLRRGEPDEGRGRLPGHEWPAGATGGRAVSLRLPRPGTSFFMLSTIRQTPQLPGRPDRRSAAHQPIIRPQFAIEF